MILQALETDSQASLLTTPFALTNDNKEVIFKIEQKEPYAVGVSTGVTAYQGFESEKATSQLKITPRITSEDNLTLEIDLQIQSFTDVARGNAPPPSNGRSYQGTVTVPNRQYVVFGGLEQESEVEARSKIPLLGDIPVVGYLFGKTDRRKERRRIYCFVRPVIFTDEGFAGERNATAYARERLGVDHLFETARTGPIIPDDVLDAQAPGLRPALYEIVGAGGALGAAESAETRAARRMAAGRE